MKKRITALLLTALITIGMTACSSGSAGENSAKDSSSDSTSAEETKTLTVEEIKAQMKEEAEKNDGSINLTLWASGDDFEFFKAQTDNFTELYSDTSYTLNIKLTETSADKSGAKLLENPKKGADVLMVYDYNTDELTAKNLLSEIDTSYSQTKPTEFIDTALQTVIKDGRQYGYPISYDSRYLIYDKRVYTDPDDLESLDTLISKAKENNKVFYIGMQKDWYAEMFLITAGAKITGNDGNALLTISSQESRNAVNSLRHYAEMAGAGFEYRSDPEALTTPSSLLISGKAAGFISNRYSLHACEKAIGKENIGKAKLPAMLIDGEQKQLIGITDKAYIVVNAETVFPKTSQALAAFLTRPEALKAMSEELSADVPLKEYESTDSIQNIISHTNSFSGLFAIDTDIRENLRTAILYLFDKRGDVTDEWLDKMASRLTDRSSAEAPPWEE